MERKYILLIKDKNQEKLCYRGPGNRGQILEDIGRLGESPSKLEIVPVVGGRFQPEGIVLGVIIGAGAVGLGLWIKKKIKELCTL